MEWGVAKNWNWKQSDQDDMQKFVWCNTFSGDILGVFRLWFRDTWSGNSQKELQIRTRHLWNWLYANFGKFGCNVLFKKHWRVFWGHPVVSIRNILLFSFIHETAIEWIHFFKKIPLISKIPLNFETLKIPPNEF